MDNGQTPSGSAESSLTEVAIAILYQGDRFLLQLRDDIPTIRYPGHWAFFGGHLDPGEHPDQAMVRELQEEIGYAPPQLTRYRSYPDGSVIRHVYQGYLDVGIESLNLQEGWDLDWLTLTQIQAGEHYSQQAGRICPIGRPHRQILLDFAASQLLPRKAQNVER